jgi:hypothetical protein
MLSWILNFCQRSNRFAITVRINLNCNSKQLWVCLEILMIHKTARDDTINREMRHEKMPQICPEGIKRE